MHGCSRRLGRYHRRVIHSGAVSFNHVRCKISVGCPAEVDSLFQGFWLTRYNVNCHRIVRCGDCWGLACHRYRDWRSRGLHHCYRQREIRPPIDNPKRVVKTIFKGDVVRRSQHIARKPRDRGGAINVYCRPSPLPRIASPDDDERMHPWGRIAAGRSDMDSVDKPVKSIRCPLRVGRGNSCQVPRQGRVVFVERIPVSRQDHLGNFWKGLVLPKRSNHLSIPLSI